MTKDLDLAFVKPSAKVLASPRVFRPHGKSGTEFSDYIPHIASRADDVCLLRSMHTEAFNHHPGQSLLMSGSTQLGRPTVGAWVSYGLGSESDDLPAFVVLSSGRGASGGSSNWSNGFLDSTYQGVVFRNTGEPILYLKNPPGVSNRTQRARLDAIRKLNLERFQATGDTEIASRIQSYELAFRMQAAAPDLLDFSKESKATLEMYGVGSEPTHPYATNCLLARRMVEKGVRFVMLAHASWDDHQEIDKKLGKNCQITDQPAGALLKDLRQRGLLDSTLVVWAGEFGRTPMGQLERVDEAAGRDHHAKCFSAWMAGGGIQGGQVIGKTDELGLGIIEDPVHIHDLQAPRARTRSRTADVQAHGQGLSLDGRRRKRDRPDLLVALQHCPALVDLRPAMNKLPSLGRQVGTGRATRQATMVSAAFGSGGLAAVTQPNSLLSL